MFIFMRRARYFNISGGAPGKKNPALVSCLNQPFVWGRSSGPGVFRPDFLRYIILSNDWPIEDPEDEDFRSFWRVHSWSAHEMLRLATGSAVLTSRIRLGSILSELNFNVFTLPETNIAPENWWSEDDPCLSGYRNWKWLMTILRLLLTIQNKIPLHQATVCFWRFVTFQLIVIVK